MHGTHKLKDSHCNHGILVLETRGVDKHALDRNPNMSAYLSNTAQPIAEDEDKIFETITTDTRTQFPVKLIVGFNKRHVSTVIESPSGAQNHSRLVMDLFTGPDQTIPVNKVWGEEEAISKLEEILVNCMAEALK